jgi:hypothetical protein
MREKKSQDLKPVASPKGDGRKRVWISNPLPRRKGMGEKESGSQTRCLAGRGWEKKSLDLKPVASPEGYGRKRVWISNPLPRRKGMGVLFFFIKKNSTPMPLR